jgi:methionyl-tRNA formyltransferase
VLERRLRAFDPFPGLRAEIAGEPVKLWRGRVVAGQGRPGERLPSDPDRLVVACGEGALELLELQRPGGRRVTAREFLQRAPT